MSDDDDDDILLDNDEISSLFEQDFGATQDAKQDAARLANELAKHELWLKANKSELKVVKSKAHYLKTKLLPEALARLGTQVFVIAEGDYVNTQFASGQFVSGSLPKAEPQRSAAVKHLEEIQGQDLIKDTLTVDIPKRKGNAVHELMSMIEKSGFNCVRESKVHAGSLAALAREKLKNGENFSPELLGLFVGTSIKITFPKNKIKR
jgi:hypothetical protein